MHGVPLFRESGLRKDREQRLSKFFVIFAFFAVILR